MKNTGMLIAFLSLAAASAFADNPAPAPASTTPQRSMQPVPSTAASANDSKKPTDAQAKYLRSNGWKPQLRNGVTVYCKSETQTGSNFPVTRCLDGDMLEAQLRLDKINRDTAPRLMNQGTAVH